jgi:hypothetical protein
MILSFPHPNGDLNWVMVLEKQKKGYHLVGCPTNVPMDKYEISDKDLEKDLWEITHYLNSIIIEKKSESPSAWNKILIKGINQMLKDLSNLKETEW